MNDQISAILSILFLVLLPHKHYSIQYSIFIHVHVHVLENEDILFHFIAENQCFALTTEFFEKENIRTII